ncbi:MULTISPECIES: hypothetical protein [unclassified Nocardiopsis]|uniref:hypothetical protein n=1 Tax=unclassified Nocardiopsis TaxID=2649073 RepID=UPI001359628F|nr:MULTISPECIES: hypothetical protein [unclassified Nocardiopsis]
MTERREEPVAEHTTEPATPHPDTDPAEQAPLADSVGLALLVVLDTLTPPERLAFVLHDLFALPFDQIAPILDRTPRPPGNWPAGPGGACAEPTPRTRTRSGGTESWRPSWPRRAAATSPNSWPCSPPTSRSAPTRPPSCAGSPPPPAGPTGWPVRPSPSPDWPTTPAGHRRRRTRDHLHA